jgi:uncharacterized membrane protein YfcA
VAGFPQEVLLEPELHGVGLRAGDEHAVLAGREHIDWALAGEFALGQVPGSAVGGQFAHHVEGPVIRRAFGLFLVAFGLFFTIDRIVAR